MEWGQLLHNIPMIYIITVSFYGMLFAFREVSHRASPERRLPIIIGLLLLNLLTGQLVFLLIGAYGLAWTQTKKQERKGR